MGIYWLQIVEGLKSSLQNRVTALNPSLWIYESITREGPDQLWKDPGLCWELAQQGECFVIYTLIEVNSLRLAFRVGDHQQWMTSTILCME